jgi:hypothetical protein
MHIKHEYDAALDDALASIYDNVYMRGELASAEEMMVRFAWSCMVRAFLMGVILALIFVRVALTATFL